MAFCKKCGTELPKEANFCPKCGLSIKDVKTEQYQVSSDDLVKTVKKLLHEGNVRRIIIKDENGRILLDLPATVGLIGAVIAPWLAALGTIAALASNCTIAIERRE